MNQKTKKITKIFEWDGKITSPHPQPFSLMRRREKSAAFTLAETLITVVILGILAAILVPNLIKNQVENANRTKVKKAMAAYEKAINMMIIENDIKSTEALRELGQDNCQYTKEYFKTVQDGENNCIFKAADRVWWDITDITNPIISLKDEITDVNVAAIANNALSLNADKTSFAFIGRFDDVGSLRIDDNAYEQGLKNNDTNKKYMTKLWYFIGNLQLTGFDKCNAEGTATCKINVNGEDVSYTRITIDKDSTTNVKGCVYYRETNSRNCSTVPSTAKAGDYYVNIYNAPTEAEAKDVDNCKASLLGESACLANGDYYEAARRKCESQGARLANIGELKTLYSQGVITVDNHAQFWAFEEHRWNDAFSLYLYNGSSSIEYDDGKSVGTWFKSVCIAN